MNKTLFYCCGCWIGTYEKDNLAADENCLYGWNEVGKLKTFHCVHELDSVNLNDRGKALKEYALAHIWEGGNE